MEFLSTHGLEIFTTVLGIIYLYLEYQASMWLWLLGIIMPLIDIYLFATNGMYAYAGISAFFVITAVYGIYSWKFGGQRNTERAISFISLKNALIYLLATLALDGVIYKVLVLYTDSEVPLLDSITTALSFAGVVALAMKYVEQWLIWILVDIISVVLFIHQGLYFRAILYLVYVFVALAGYFKWKQMAKQGQ
ncbi:MAG: nicotinamide mononucleotide transporter [Succinivibrio sp.]|nr:nicotinamide mononucleotide transporter [Succinivibrio sp.]